MLHEHVLGRDCVGRMREASAASRSTPTRFADAARKYIPLLRQHIFKENNVLFRMAERVMSEADDADVTIKFFAGRARTRANGLSTRISATKWQDGRQSFQ